jgi:hypothetical protein
MEARGKLELAVALAAGLFAPAPAARALRGSQDVAPPPRGESTIARGDGVVPPRDVEPIPGERFTWRKQAFAGWRHETSWSGEYRLPESTCGGCVLFDFDGDGDCDVFLVSAGAWSDLAPGAPFPGHALFRNDGRMRFTNVAKEAGVFGEPGAYCIGAAAADADGDGDQDLFVTGFERNWLYVNDGRGSFLERAREAGVEGGGKWASSAAFFDADLDGRLDLYVVNYVEFSIEANRKHKCGKTRTGVIDYCSPKEYTGVQDWFFHSEAGEAGGRGTDGGGADGNGAGRGGTDGGGSGGLRFRECAVERGLVAARPLAEHAKGLGVVVSDVDGDGDPDVYVANDGCANFLFLNDGQGHFTECGAIRGCAYGESGAALAGMGTDAGDVDGDGDFDLICANLDSELNSLYVNDGRGWFGDEIHASGLAAADRGEVGFGLDLFDADDDGDLDLLVANGHVAVNIHLSRASWWYLQPDQLFENTGAGRFRLVPPEKAGAYFTVRNAGRGLATGDLDGDGDLDAVILARDEPAILLENNHVPHGKRGDAFLFSLRGSTGNRDAIGAKLALTIGARTRVEEVRAGNSFCSRSDLRVHFGSGGAALADKLDVRWPDGTPQTFGPLQPGFEYRLVQGVPAAETVRELVRR